MHSAPAGGIAQIREMRDFHGAHSIVSDTKMIRLQDSNDADERMLRNDVKYIPLS